MRLSRVARAVDVLVVTLLAASAQLEVWTVDPARWSGAPAVHAALALLITLPLLVRRTYPLPVLGVVTAASWLQYELGGGLGQPWLATVLALYAVAAHAVRRDAVIGALLVAVMLVLDTVTRLREGERWDDTVPVWFVLAGVWILGRWIRRRRQEAHAVEERAAALDARTATLEEDRLAAAREAVADERARIARELHDLVAHSLGVIVIQSQAAQRMLDTDPLAARSAILSIETVGRQGLGEMRRLLDVLVTTDDDDAPLGPVPSLRDLAPLVDHVRSAGLAVDVQVTGAEAPLPPGVDLAAYRIVQEALTNTLRHARGGHARVAVTYGAGTVEVEVLDDGPLDGAPGSGTTPGGHGLIGMQQRVALYGGTLSTGPRPDAGGFVVRARIPLDGQPLTDAPVRPTAPSGARE